MKVQLNVKNREGDVREFEKAHALTLLKFTNTQFELPEDSTFEFVDNELKRKKVKGANSKKSTKGNTRGSSKARK